MTDKYTDITPERAEALARRLNEFSSITERDFAGGEVCDEGAEALRALSAEVARLKADNAAKDAVIVRMREALVAANEGSVEGEYDGRTYDVCCFHNDGDPHKPECWVHKVGKALELTPAALADCVVVSVEDAYFAKDTLHYAQSETCDRPESKRFYDQAGEAGMRLGKYLLNVERPEASRG